jgi:hypothetical protein
MEGIKLQKVKSYYKLQKEKKIVLNLYYLMVLIFYTSATSQRAPTNTKKNCLEKIKM